MAYEPHFQSLPLLVFGLSGQIGSGVSFVRDKLTQEITTYGYTPVIVDVSRVILDELFDRLTLQTDPKRALKEGDASATVRRVWELQQRGNVLREQIGRDAVASLALSSVIHPWLKDHAWTDRVAFMIDSLKHPHEVRFLREVFGSAFYAVGVVTTDSVRMDRLTSQKNYTKQDFSVLSERDAEESNDFGQKAVKTIAASDYFMANDFSTKESISVEVNRFLRLVFSVGVETPGADEYGMNVATRAARKSGCLSRQVGAAILAEDGEVLATGRNDVPQVGGGLYTSESARDQRCWAKSERCYNDKHKEELVDELVASIRAVVDCQDKEAKDIRDRLVDSRIGSLIEFSRAVHAEMDAIVAIARRGQQGMVGSTLYCTTYPCHNCARHIIDAGIMRVVYLEPYEKSLARRLHPDAICDPLRGKEPDKIPFEVYGGAAPRRYDQFFGTSTKRKGDDGRLVDRDRRRRELLPIEALCLEELEARVRKVVERHSGEA